MTIKNNSDRKKVNFLFGTKSVQIGPKTTMIRNVVLELTKCANALDSIKVIGNLVYNEPVST